MPGCAAIGCNNRSEKGFTMKCFPRNPKLRKIWTERVSRADWEPSNNSFLCHVHFEADQWTITQSGRIKLKKNAVPSIFTVTSTRKSPRKRRKLAKGEEDLFIIEYSDDSASRALSAKINSSSYNRFPTILSRTVYAQSPRRTANKIAMDKGETPETIVVSDDMSDTSTKEKKRTNSVILHDSKAMDTTNNAEVTIKKESPPHSNHELDDIEEKLRSICDGEPQSDDKNTIEREIDRKNVIVEDKRKAGKLSQEEKTTSKHSSNNENSSKSQENVARNTSSHKRRSAVDTTIDAKKPVVTNITNGTISLKENSGKASNETSATMRSSTFTIKLTGIEEDVTEIVEGLGTEPILKYKSSTDSSNSNKNFVTSVISVTDTYVIKCENDENETTMRRTEIRRWPSLEIKKETCEEINGTEKRSSTKLALESPEEDDDDNDETMDHQRLRKKIKFQEEMIRKLTTQLNSSKETQTSTNHMSTRSQTKGKVIAPKTCNGDCQNERKDKLLKDFSKRIDNANETISRLHKSLNEERQNVKNALTQIRQRDNRLKELNWKLNKASKYIERAEKNANNYRKKMMNLQNFVAKKNLEAEACPRSMEQALGNESTTFSSNVAPMETAEENDPDTTNEDVVYRTVQDIFEESNHGDDDPMIDNPEDFMRQFAGSL